MGKLVFYEFKKIISKKVFIIVFALCFILNCFIFYFIQQTGDYLPFVLSDFSETLDNYMDLPIDKAEEKLNLEMKSYDILMQIEALSGVENPEEFDQLLLELSEMRERFPDSYILAENIYTSEEDTSEQSYFTYTIYNQIEYIKSYPSFINEMRERADEQSSVSIFSNQNDFSYNNLYKTVKDYEHLSNINLTIGNDFPINAVDDYDITNLFILVIVFLSCVYLFVEEREKGLYMIVCSSKKGRSHTIIAKLLALCIVTFVISMIFSLSIYAVSSLIYGNFQYDRSIQSVSEYRNCIYDLNIGQFCILTMFVKSLGMIVIASVLAMVFVVSSTSIVTYIVSVSILFVELVFVNSTKVGVFYNYIKYINLFYVIDSNHFLGNYLNLNVFSSPVSICHINLLVFTILFILCCIITVIVFTLKVQTSRTTYLSTLIEKVRLKSTKTTGTVSVLLSEFYKYLIAKKMIVFLILVIMFSMVSSLGDVKYPYTDISDVEYRAYMGYLSGKVTSEKSDYISEQKLYLNLLNERIDEYANDNTISESSKSVAINTINNILETKGEAFSCVEEQYYRLLEMQEEGKEVEFIDENLYPGFIYNSSREWYNVAVLNLLLIISIPFIFTVDFKNDVIILLSSTKYGKVKLYICKIIVVLVIFFICFAAIYLPYYIRFWRTYGSASMDTSIACLMAYQNISNQLNVLQTVLITTGCYYLIALLVATGIVLITVYIRSYLLSVILATMIFEIPCLVIYPLDNLRVGAMFIGNYYVVSIIISLSCIIAALFCLMKSAMKFTVRRTGRRYIAKV